MNGAGHYTEAERLVAEAQSKSWYEEWTSETLAAAQVHATLAAAAAAVELADISGQHVPKSWLEAVAP